MATLTTVAIILHMHKNIDLCGTPCLGGQLYDVFNQSLNYETVNNKNFKKVTAILCAQRN